MNMNHWDQELDDSAEVFLNELLQMQAGENVLIYGDRGSDHRLACTIQTHVGRRKGRAEWLELNSSWALEDQARQLADKISRGAFHVICEISEQYFYHTSAWQVAREVGARAFSIAGLNKESFIRCVGMVDHERMFQFGMALRALLHKSHRIRIHTPKGTDIRMELSQNHRLLLTARLLKRPRGYILPPCGRFDPGTRTTFLGGQLAFQGIPSTIEGTAVIDGYMWPPAEIGPLEQPLLVKIEQGRVIEIGGCPAKSKILARWLEPQRQTLCIEHFCIGFNPGARLSGKILEAERVFGFISVGMGRHTLHTDGVIKSPSMEGDRIVIQENGSFVPLELSSLELARSRFFGRGETPSKGISCAS